MHIDPAFALFNPPTKDLMEALHQAAFGAGDHETHATLALEAIEGGADPNPGTVFRYQPLQLACFAMRRGEELRDCYLPVALRLIPGASDECKQQLMDSLPIIGNEREVRLLERELASYRLVPGDQSIVMIESQMRRKADKLSSKWITQLERLGWKPDSERMSSTILETMICNHLEKSLDCYLGIYERQGKMLPGTTGDGLSLMGLVHEQFTFVKPTARKKREVLQRIGERILHTGLVDFRSDDPPWGPNPPQWIELAQAEGRARQIKRNTTHTPQERPRPRF